MARILLAWELGGGFGHAMPLAEMGRALAASGHECAYALRDLGLAHALLDVRSIRLYQSPLLLPERRRGNIAHTYADILANIGYCLPGALSGLLAAWRHIYADFRPDLVVFDHAPTAKAAARGLDIPLIELASSGFTLPPAVSPLPDLRAPQPDSAAARLERETAVTDALNHALREMQLPELDRLGELFRADARILLSVPELDPYGPRDDIEYWGPLEHGQGVAPGWPAVGGRKIFAYLRQFPGRTALLETLAATAQPTLVHLNGVDAAECARLSSGTMRVSPVMLDVRRALAECDLVITHGGSLASAALLAGKPLLALPLHLEQQLTAVKIESLGAGLNAPKLAPGGMRRKLGRLLNEPAFGAAARAFAARYPQFPINLAERFSARVEDLLA